VPTKLATAPTTVATLVTSAHLSVDIRVIRKTRAKPAYTLEDPTGRSQQLTETVRIGAHKTFGRSFSYEVDPSYPKGAYELTVSAATSRGTSSATATLEIN
jgi:hypothetical protein